LPLLISVEAYVFVAFRSIVRYDIITDTSKLIVNMEQTVKIP